MNVYREPPPVLPSLRPMRGRETIDIADLAVAIFYPHGTPDDRERDVRVAAMLAPCPAFASGPPLGRWYIPPPPKSGGPDRFSTVRE